MFRTFCTHELRKEKELSGKLWDLEVLEGEQKGEHYQTLVPGCWEMIPGLENYRGKARYTTAFRAGGNVCLVFKGVSHMAWVYVDGQEAGSHYNAYTPFRVVLPGMEEGLHELSVVVDNSFAPEYALNRPNDYMSYGGISRGVGLEVVPEVYLDNVHVTPLAPSRSGWNARVEVTAENLSDSEREVSLEIFLAAAGAPFHSGHTETAVRTAAVKAAPGKHVIYAETLDFPDVDTWSIENPALYRITLRLFENSEAVDDLTDRIGFRTIGKTKDRLLLNGRPVRIKGINRHEDHPQYGCALPLEAMSYDLRLIKDLGCNSVRTSHYPNDERFLDLCDELGILVWEEHHLRGSSEQMMRNPFFEPQCEQVIEEMITYHYNHPCIYIWGILNECASDTDYGRSCYEKQYALIRRLDTSRPCSSASCKYGKDICLDLPDVVSWNMYPYWYEKKTAAQMFDELCRYTRGQGHGGGKPFLITETGAGAIYGFRSTDKDPWSEECQAEILDRQLTELLACPECMGLYIWQFCDVRVNREWFEKRPRTRNNKGIVDEFRRRKLAYPVVKHIFEKYPDYWDEE